VPSVSRDPTVGERSATLPLRFLCSCLPCLHLLLRAADKLEATTAHLELLSALDDDRRLATDAAALASALAAELAAVEAVIGRQASPRTRLCYRQQWRRPC
jgi:hypothetical protein